MRLNTTIKAWAKNLVVIFKSLLLSSRLQPIDSVGLTLMVVLSLFIGILLCSGGNVIPYVRDFNWHSKVIGASDTFFTLTFSRPVDRASVEANFHISPPLPGKVSWTGRQLVYTLTAPAKYDTTYQVALRTISGSKKVPLQWQPFSSEFHTRDRIFAYLGIEGEEKGRLILYNLTHKQKTILTPKNLVVTDFKPYATGDKILFFASDWSNYSPGFFKQQVYTVSTGISSTSGKIDKILDNLNYQNLEYDLSADGQVIVVHRVERDNLKDAGLWVVRPNTQPQPLNNPPGSQILLAPDSNSLGLSLFDGGVAILPLTPSSKPLDYLPAYNQVLAFSKDGVQAVMVKLGNDNTQSLFLVTNQGLHQELISTTGEHLQCEFDPKTPNLYCLVRLLPSGKINDEHLTVVMIDLKTFAVKPLLQLPYQWDTQMSLSPDGLSLLFDQVVTSKTLAKKGDLVTDFGAAIITSDLILLPTTNTTPESMVSKSPLPLHGFHPRWLP